MRDAKLQKGKGEEQSLADRNGQLCLGKKEAEIQLLAANLHRKGEMAALGVSDDAGVHGGLGTPAPLQISHSVLVQVAGQHGGEARTHAPGGKLEATLSRHEAGSERKEAAESEPPNHGASYLLCTPTIAA